MINLSSMLNISELFAPSQMIDLQVFVRYSKLSWSWNIQKIKSSELIYPCIYKCEFDPWKPVYFALDNQHYYLLNRENPDSYSVCKSIINREHYFESNNVNPAFEYFPKQKILVCRYFSDIPTLFTRLLMLANPEKYTEEEIYLSGISDYREQYFDNIDFNFVKELDKRLIR